MEQEPIYPGEEWMPVEGEEVYSPGWGDYGIVKHVNRKSAIIHFPNTRHFASEWIEVPFEDFHKSRREELERKNEWQTKPS